MLGDNGIFGLPVIKEVPPVSYLLYISLLRIEASLLDGIQPIPHAQKSAGCHIIRPRDLQSEYISPNAARVMSLAF